MKIIKKYFRWTGIDNNGCYHQDAQYLKNKKTLIKTLHKKNITLINIKSQTLIHLRHRINKKYIIEFIKQLSILLSANINLLDAITILKKEQQHPPLKSMLSDIQQKIRAGCSLSHAIQPLCHHDHNTISNILHAAEKTGKLALLLNQLSTQLQQQYQIKKKMTAALYYPITLLSVALLVSISLLVFVIPQFESIYSSFNATLPLFTQLMIKVARATRADGLSFMLILFVISTLFSIFYKRSSLFKQYYQRALLTLPMIKNIILDHNLSQWTQILDHSYAAGLTLIEAITLANQTLSNRYIQQVFSDMPSELEAGNSLSQVIKKLPFFNLRQQHLFTLGDQAGALQQALQHISQQCTERLQNTLTNLSKLLEPVIIIGVALICGSCIIAMYLPIFNIGAIA